MEQPILINNYLSEKRKKIFKYCGKAIRKHQKIHIKSPVGSGKTTIATEIMEKYPDKNFIVLFPYISITEQVLVKLESKGLNAVIVNGKTIIKVIADNKHVIQNRIMLATVDSTHKLINELKMSSQDTVVIIDETHTFLQSPRDDHTRSVEAILAGGFPVIGFSATPSMWVIKFLLEVDEQVEFQYKKGHKQKVIQTTVKHGLLRTVAEEITANQKGMTVVFMEYKRQQNKLEEYILECDATLKVCSLNADTKNSTHKKEWQHLMNNDSLSADYDVYLINSVAQAGVNIINKNIDRVYLVDCFDPFGFAQYLGRCRNYTKKFHYFNSTYGKQLELFDGIIIEKTIDFIQKVLDSTDTEMQNLYRKLIPTMSDIIFMDEENNLVPNKCKIANNVFEKLRGLSGEELLYAMGKLFPNIKFITMETLDGMVVTPAVSQAKSRNKAKLDLREIIIESHDIINDLVVQMNYKYDEANMHYMIATQFNSGTRVLKKKEDKLKEIKKLVKRSQISPARLVTINSMYRQSHFSENVLDELLKLHNNQVVQIKEAIIFFGNTTSTTIKKIMSGIYHQRGELLTAKEWKKQLEYEVVTSVRSPKLLKNLYTYCLQTKRSNGMLKLVKVNETIEDYLEAYNFQHLTYFQGKLSPK